MKVTLESLHTTSTTTTTSRSSPINGNNKRVRTSDAVANINIITSSATTTSSAPITSNVVSTEVFIIYLYVKVYESYILF